MILRTRLAVGATAVATALVVGVTVGMSAPAVGKAAPSSKVTKTLAYWAMDETAGSHVMRDSGGKGYDGTIGSQVQVGASYGGATGYRFSYTKPNTPPAQPQRLVLVDNSGLNPGTGDYAITLRYRTTHSFGNILQKGQNNVRGGYFKIELPNGLPTCLFKDANGNRRAIKSTLAVKDGQWHTVRCERTSSGVTVSIDGTYSRFIKGATGNIANNMPLSIGGKPSCDQVKVTCDYFAGDIDWVRIETS